MTRWGGGIVEHRTNMEIEEAPAQAAKPAAGAVCNSSQTAPGEAGRGAAPNGYLICEHRGIFILLMIGAGMMGAYTFNLRGGVFSNAQTANVVMMAVAFGRGEWESGLYFLLPISAYIAGAFVSEFFPNRVKKLGLFRWDTYLVGFEALVLFGVGFVPLNVTDHLVQVTINFICSMQYNTFRQAEGVPMATTFCTNHVRQIGICLAHFVRHRDDPAILRRAGFHLVMIAAFLFGAAVLTVCCGYLWERAIWLAIVPLGIVFLLLAHADIFREHGLLWRAPAGHSGH